MGQLAESGHSNAADHRVPDMPPAGNLTPRQRAAQDDPTLPLAWQQGELILLRSVSGLHCLLARNSLPQPGTS